MSLAPAALVLARPAAGEQTLVWTLSQPWWGPSYSLDAYLERERLLLGAPLARDGGLTPWILTDAGPAGRRPVLSSCETLRKRALVRGPDGAVRDVCAHGIASVFTPPESRRRGYAARMLSLLRQRFAELEAASPGDAAFSVLFSDIGKRFYARLGWIPFASAHLSFPVKPAAAAPRSAAASSSAAAVRPILDADVPAMARLDEQLLRKRIASPPADPAKSRVAIVPDLDTLQWHFARESFMSNHLFSRAPAVHGAIYTPSAPNSRVWGIWVRNQPGGTGSPDKNVLAFLRFVVEDDAISDAELSEAIRAIVGEATSEAREWMCANVDMWNPDERTRRLVADMGDLEAQFVVRETDSIPSLQWFRDGSAADVEWIASEKYEWC